jgi:ADP-ribose pyrophosphatase
MNNMRKSIYRGSVVDLGTEPVELPDGRRLDLEVVRHPGGAAAVALDDRNRVCLLRQYRHAAGGWLWELPAGKLDAGESPAATVARELEEEAGVRAARWDRLASFLTTPGFCDEVIHVYLARELTPVARNPGAHECIEVHWPAFDEALEQARNGTIRDAKTLLGLFYAGLFLKARPGS